MPQFLCEGFEGAFFPEVTYVRQGDKIYFFSGNKGLSESVGDTTQIVESFDDLELEDRQLGERTVKIVKDGRWVIEGPFQRSDVPNANKRVYGRKIWERLIGDPNSKPMQTLKARGMIGHLEHPKDGRTDGKEGALVVTSLKLRDDGIVWGEAELLDTPNGLILQEYTRKRVRWGVSSRGTGTVKDDGHVNEEDYMVETWDGVMRPSVPGAYANPKGKKLAASESDGEQDLNTGKITEEVEAFVSEVKSLTEEDVEALDEDGRHTLNSKLLHAMQRVSSLAKSDALPSSQAYELQDWLTAQMGSLHETERADMEALIDQTLDKLQGETGSEDAFRHVVESLQKRMRDVVSDNEVLRTRADDAEERVRGLKGERDLAWRSFEDAKAKVESLQQRLTIAVEQIAEQSAHTLENPVTEAVEAAIKQVPNLAKYQQVLETAKTPEQVETLAEQLLPAVLGFTEPKRSAAPPKRSTLPSGVVESEEVPKATRKSTNPSAGARRAGKVIASMAANKK